MVVAGTRQRVGSMLAPEFAEPGRHRLVAALSREFVQVFDLGAFEAMEVALGDAGAAVAPEFPRQRRSACGAGRQLECAGKQAREPTRLTLKERKRDDAKAKANES